MTKIDYLSNQFLIAMPSLADNNFSHSVSYLCQHNEDGALAVVINRPTGMNLGHIFEQMGIETSLKQVKDTPVFMGGPVQQERGFIIHNTGTDTWDSSIPVSDITSLTSSRDILQAIAEGDGPKHYLIALGYAGWGEGQLEKEIISNAWLNTPYDEKILYETPAKNRWLLAANSLGIDINQLTFPAGHG
ncbi:MAG: YqgE/AlgH family protein [Gammaproteobacteria bacterium]|nr:MAG: YqgE/AlgH family protein [Gammaproteobacteria bacterium]